MWAYLWHRYWNHSNSTEAGTLEVAFGSADVTEREERDEGDFWLLKKTMRNHFVSTIRNLILSFQHIDNPIGSTRNPK
jgi:hypothetical protein